VSRFGEEPTTVDVPAVTRDALDQLDACIAILTVAKKRVVEILSSPAPQVDRDELRSRADKGCLVCHGEGFGWLPMAGREGRCDCTKPLAPIEERETA
jgi:hypothetical protein